MGCRGAEIDGVREILLSVSSGITVRLHPMEHTAHTVQLPFLGLPVSTVEWMASLNMAAPPTSMMV